METETFQQKIIFFICRLIKASEGKISINF